MTLKKPILCTYCGKSFVRKNGGREKQCSLNCRFWSKVQKTDGCWNWQAALFKTTGYGQFALTSTKPETAHRMAYKLACGDIQDGLFVLHKCDNRKCCNPVHLFLGTQKNNIDDMCQKGRYVGNVGFKFSKEAKAKRSATMKTAWLIAKATGHKRPTAIHYGRT